MSIFSSDFLAAARPSDAGHAEEMPGRVLDVVRIDRLMQLELLTTVAEFARVIVGNAPLPELRRRLRVELRRAIEVGQRPGDVIVAELLHALGDQVGGIVRADGGRERREQQQFWEEDPRYSGHRFYRPRTK